MRKAGIFETVSEPKISYDTCEVIKSAKEGFVRVIELKPVRSVNNVNWKIRY